MDLDFFDTLDALDSDIFDDGTDDAQNNESFEEEIEGIKVEMEEVKKNTSKKKVPVGIMFPERNLLNEDMREKILFDLLMQDLRYVTAPRIFIITMDGFISGIKFKEETHTKLLEPTFNIPIIKSNDGEKTYSGYTSYTHIKKTRRGRNKKQEKKNKKVKNLKSQITFYVRRPEASMSDKLIVHKLFRSGNIQISGYTYDDIDTAKATVQRIIDLIADTPFAEETIGYNDDGDQIVVRQKMELTSLCSIMENYKFEILLDQRESINLWQLKQELIKNNYLVNTVNDTGEPISLLYVSYDGSLAAMKFVMECPLMPKKKKVLVTNVFSTGKVNILGCCGSKYARVVSKFLDAILAKCYNSVIVYNRDCNWGNYLLINTGRTPCKKEDIDRFDDHIVLGSEYW